MIGQTYRRRLLVSAAAIAVASLSHGSALAAKRATEFSPKSSAVLADHVHVRSAPAPRVRLRLVKRSPVDPRDPNACEDHVAAVTYALGMLTRLAASTDCQPTRDALRAAAEPLRSELRAHIQQDAPTSGASSYSMASTSTAKLASVGPYARSA